MGGSSLHLLPLACFFIFPATFLLTYSIAVLLGHTEPDFPYISDTGTYSPESCIFGQAVNIGAFLVVVTVYLRYRQLAELYRSHSAQSNINRANNAAAVFGILSAAGMSLSANFQETNVRSVHIFGALMAFGGASVYLWLQAVCSYQTHPLLNSLAMAHIRLALALVAAIFFFIGCACAIIAHTLFDGLDPTKWYPSNGGWTYHVISTASEWICASTFDIFMLTLVPEFKNLTIDNPQIYVTVESFDYSPTSYHGQFSSVESLVTPESQSSHTADQVEFSPDLAAEIAQIVSDNNVNI